KINEILEVMVPAARNHRFRIKPHLRHQIVEDVQRNIVVIQEAHGAPLITPLQALHQRIYETVAHVSVDVQLRITGELDAVCLYRVVFEDKKQVIQAIPDNIIE